MLYLQKTQRIMKLALVGATGLVGTRMLQVLEERDFPVDELVPVASDKSIGRSLSFKGKEWRVVSAEEAIASGPALALFSAGGEVSGRLAPRFAKAGCTVIDNSSFWRMDPGKKLVVPEINGDVLTRDDRIIANPNCSTIQMVLPLAPIHRELGIKRIVVSTYQSVTGTGYRAINQMNTERTIAEDKRRQASLGPLEACTAMDSWGEYPAVYPHPIDQNILPHIDSFLENGYTKEEMKMVNETKKILRDDTIAVTATTVRVPVQGGHSESINVETEKPFEIGFVRELMASMPGVVVQDDPSKNVYPMPLYAWGKDEVFVGRIRRDFTLANAFNFWCVSDNIRKGAATNAVQIAQYLLDNKMI